LRSNYIIFHFIGQQAKIESWNTVHVSCLLQGSVLGLLTVQGKATRKRHQKEMFTRLSVHVIRIILLRSTYVLSYPHNEPIPK